MITSNVSVEIHNLGKPQLVIIPSGQPISVMHQTRSPRSRIIINVVEKVSSTLPHAGEVETKEVVKIIDAV